MSDSQVLWGQDTHKDSVLCVNAADINADGVNEIIIGTYSKQMLIYTAKTFESFDKNTKLEYELNTQYKFPSPVMKKKHF